MYHIIAFIPKSLHSDTMRLSLFNCGGRAITCDTESDRFYSVFSLSANSSSAVGALVEFVNSLNGVIRVNDEYLETFRVKTHLEIADEDGELVTSDGNYMFDKDA
jgi:ATP/ADP translocase